MHFASNFATGLSALAVTTFQDDNKNDSSTYPFPSKATDSMQRPSYPSSTCDLICRSRVVFPVVYSSATIGISMVMTAQNSWDWCNENPEMCKSSITSTCNMISEKLVADSRSKLLDDNCDDTCLVEELGTASQKAAYWAMDWAIGGIQGTMSGDDEKSLMEVKWYLGNLNSHSKMAEIVTQNVPWLLWPRMIEEKLPIGGQNWNGISGDAIMLMARFFDIQNEIPGSIDDTILLPGKWLGVDSSGFAQMWERLATSRASDVRNSWLGKMARAVYEVVQSGHVKPREQYPSIYGEGNSGFPTWQGPANISPREFIYIPRQIPGDKVPDFDATFSRPGSVFEKRGEIPDADEIFVVEKYDVHSNTHYSRYCMDAAAPGEVRGDYRRWVEVDGQGIPTTAPPTHFWLHKKQLKKVTRDDFKDIDVSKDVDAGEGPSTHNVDALNQPSVAVEDNLASNYELVAEQAVDNLRVAIVSLNDAKGKAPLKFNLPELLISKPLFRGPEKVAYNIVKVSKGKEKVLYGDLHGVLQSDVRDPGAQTRLITAEEHLRDQSPEQLEKERMRDVLKKGEEEAEDRAKEQMEREKESLWEIEKQLRSIRDGNQQSDPEPNQPVDDPDLPHSDPDLPGPPPPPAPPLPPAEPQPEPQPDPQPNPPSPPSPPTTPTPPKPPFPKIPPLIPPIAPIPGHDTSSSSSSVYFLYHGDFRTRHFFFFVRALDYQLRAADYSTTTSYFELVFYGDFRFEFADYQLRVADYSTTTSYFGGVRYGDPRCEFDVDVDVE
ncbi:hypothetical protein AC578_930 [Pseudocercospora eumusae]|uniref:Uncharacterized protein n=1 Tax=Pseudocercospora eumusae TaxID=321146 RepID=A0A139HBV2_9PEZI|nr:hypothetical protein AC578_930 [Pseudocercospora eumusae]